MSEMTSEVKRYHVSATVTGTNSAVATASVVVDEAPRGHGDWVRYSDYEALASKADRLERIVKAMPCRCINDGDGMIRTCERCAALTPPAPEART